MDESVMLLLEDFKAWQESRASGSKQTSVKYYADAYEFVENYGHPLYADKAVLEKWFTETQKQVSNATANRKLSALRALFKYLAVKNVRPDDPSSTLEALPINHRLPRPVEHNDILKIIDYINKHLEDSKWMYQDLAIFEILYGSGLRRSECATLKYENIITSTTLRVVGKGNKERITIITEPEFKAIVNWSAKLTNTDPDPKVFWTLKREKWDSYLFFSPDGTAYAERADPGHYIYLRIKAYADILGIDVEPHKLRHSFGTNLHNNGVDLADIAQVMGHEDVRTTQGYAEVGNRVLNRIRERHSRNSEH